MNFDPRSPRCEGDHGEVSMLGECHTVSTAGVIEPHPAAAATCIYTLCPPRQPSLLLRNARLHRMVTDAIRTPRRYGNPDPSLHRFIAPSPPAVHPLHHQSISPRLPSTGHTIHKRPKLAYLALKRTFPAGMVELHGGIHDI